MAMKSKSITTLLQWALIQQEWGPEALSYQLFHKCLCVIDFTDPLLKWGTHDLNGTPPNQLLVKEQVSKGENRYLFWEVQAFT